MAELRVFTSSANFFLGETMQLRKDMGGGLWRIVEILTRTDDGYFARAVAERIDIHASPSEGDTSRGEPK